ncbi:Tn3 family transposase [Streptomyces lavendulocolor]|uniref:Tn3 family transposase n=1 Tax=Streptomyces lavendulocolor TaxID=67316 RepID=UPI003C2BE671
MGGTLVNFGLFDLVGMQLSPRIRDLGKVTLHRVGAKADDEERFPKAGPLLTKKANLDLVADHWDDLLRLAGSLKCGHATASLIVGKLSASCRENALAAALKEYGAIRRTIYAAKYLSDEGYRRKIARQLNKGESLHALRRRLYYAREVGAEVPAHISPARSQAVNYFGSITVDYDRELAQLDERGHRPLRVVATDEPGAALQPVPAVDRGNRRLTPVGCLGPVPEAGADG